MRTGLYSIYTFPVFKSGTVEFVCFMKISSFRLGKSSRAWAPRDYLRTCAEWIVCEACTKIMVELRRRFSSSRVSMRSVFQTKPLSLILTSLYI